MSGHTTACRSPALAFSAAIHFAMKRSASCSTVLRHSPLVLGCSHSLIGVDAESSEVVQETPHPLFSLAPYAARASHHYFSEHHALRQSRTLHERHKPANNIRFLRKVTLVLSLPVFISVSRWEIGWSARSLFRKPMQRVKKLRWAWRSVSLWHARGLHVTQPYSIVSSTSALSIRILSSRGALGRSYSSRVYFRKLHHALRTRRSTSMDRLAFWLTFPHSFLFFYPLLLLASLHGY